MTAVLEALARPPVRAGASTSSSPPDWARFVELTVELGVGLGDSTGTRGLWDTAHFDRPLTGVWSGLEPSWVQVDPCRLLEVKVTRGRRRWIDRFDASSASVTIDDPDGLLSWDAAVDDDSLDVRPGRPLRVTSRHVPTGIMRPVWRGWLEDIQDSFLPGSPPPAQFTAQDGLAEIGHIDLPEQAPVGAGERSDQRVARLLDLANWPAQWRDLDVGRITVQATNLARPVVDDLGVTADSEGGALFVDRTGNVCFRNRDWLRVAPEATAVQAVIGGPSETVCGAEYELVRRGTDVVNDVQVARAGGTLQRVQDGASIARYRQRTWSRSDYVMETDADALLLANRILRARSSGQVRMTALKVTPTDDLATWEFVLSVDYGWRLEVHYQSPVNPAVTWVRQVHVQGVEHTITPARWETVLQVDDPYADAGDVWDGTAGWDRALWVEAF